MAAPDNASLTNEPALSGWWVAACFAAAGLILLFAALIQQASKLSDSIITLTGGRGAQSPQAARVTADPVSENSALDSVQAIDIKDEQVAQQAVEQVQVVVPIEVSDVLSNEVDESVDTSDVLSNEVDESVDTTDILSSEVDDPVEITDALMSSEVGDPVETTDALSSEVDEPVPSDLEQPSSVLVESTEPPEIEPIALAETSNSDGAIVNEAENPQTSAELSLAALRQSVLTEMSRRSKRIRFLPASSELTLASERLLGQAFEDLFLYAESDIVIEISSLDSVGDSSNQLLSNDRAQTIRDFLIERGLEAERLIISLLPNSAEFDGQQFVNIKANL